MGDLFNRYATISVRRTDRITIAGKTIINLLGETRVIRDLRISFKVEKTSESSPNTGTISIYNMNPISRSRFSSDKSFLELTAGYASGTRLTDLIAIPGTQKIFSGFVKKAVTEKVGGDIVTTIEAGDGVSFTESAVINKAFAQGTPYAIIFAALAATFSLPMIPSPAATAILSTKLTTTGYSAYGMTRAILDKLTEGLGLEWSIQDGNLLVTERGGSLLTSLVILEEDTGLVGVPKKTTKGVEFTSLLNPKIVVKSKVSVISKFVTGIFVANKVTHEGDTHGSKWETQVEGVGLGLSLP